MQEVTKLINSFIKDINDAEISKLFAQINSGKMVRSKLVLKIADNNKNAAKLCAIIETIHLASLLHDDVIDNAMTRRKTPSINALEGDKTAIMMGDILYSKAFFELTSLGETIAKIISNAVVKLSLGEFKDVFLSRTFNHQEALYAEMIYLKTASLIEASCEAAAVLAGKDRTLYAQYGKNLGLCFQIVDDILDISQDEKNLGKPAFNDFKEGKATLPYIYLYEALEKNEKQRLLSLFKQDLSSEDLAWIKDKMQSTKALEKTKDLAKNYAQNAAKIQDAQLSKLALELITRTN